MAFTERQVTLADWPGAGDTVYRISYPSTYTHPAEGTAGTVAFSDGTTTKVFYNADGYTQLGMMGTNTLYRHYGNKHFESTYVAGLNTNPSDVGWGTSQYGGSNFGSTTDSQVIDIPGHSGTYSVEGVMAYHGNPSGSQQTFTFAITPDDEVEIGNDVWDDYWFVFSNTAGTNTIALDGDRLVAAAQNAPWEQWGITNMLSGEWATFTSIVYNGATFHFKIQQKAV